jgi:GH25 family lysozyme M1 (1,4-beta-N-acetylmuramidase)
MRTSRFDLGRERSIAWAIVASVFAGVLSQGQALAASNRTQPAPRGIVVRASYIEGIDVSHWQGTIDWTRVAGSGKKFAFAKATEGQTYNDPTYSTNRAGAEGRGMSFGAYHFARPDTTQNDAVLEADHFAAVAAYRPGEIRPSLDLEDSGGLSVSTLNTWVKAFLNELYKKTGKRAMIYTNPSFWQTYMGDTTWFANNGYTLLWIANWGVSKPSVPANNWGGHGWTFWQWTSCESVPGISGCVDGDRTLRPYTLEHTSMALSPAASERQRLGEHGHQHRWPPAGWLTSPPAA